MLSVTPWNFEISSSSINYCWPFDPVLQKQLCYFNLSGASHWADIFYFLIKKFEKFKIIEFFKEVKESMRCDCIRGEPCRCCIPPSKKFRVLRWVGDMDVQFRLCIWIGDRLFWQLFWSDLLIKSVLWAEIDTFWTKRFDRGLPITRVPKRSTGYFYIFIKTS